MKKRDTIILIAIFTLCAIVGGGLGYLAFGPIGVRADNSSYDTPQQQPATASFNIESPTLQDIHDEQEQAGYSNEYDNEKTATGFIVTTSDGYIVVFYASNEGKGGQIMETTSTHVGTLPPEEQDRLAHGIRVDTYEALLRLLEDYGS